MDRRPARIPIALIAGILPLLSACVVPPPPPAMPVAAEPAPPARRVARAPRPRRPDPAACRPTDLSQDRKQVLFRQFAARTASPDAASPAAPDAPPPPPPAAADTMPCRPTGR